MNNMLTETVCEKVIRDKYGDHFAQIDQEK